MQPPQGPAHVELAAHPRLDFWSTSNPPLQHLAPVVHSSRQLSLAPSKGDFAAAYFWWDTAPWIVPSTVKGRFHNSQGLISSTFHCCGTIVTSLPSRGPIISGCQTDIGCLLCTLCRPYLILWVVIGSYTCHSQKYHYFLTDLSLLQSTIIITLHIELFLFKLCSFCFLIGPRMIKH